MAKAIGCFTSGSPAKRVALNPGGTLISLAAASGESPANLMMAGGGTASVEAANASPEQQAIKTTRTLRAPLIDIDGARLCRRPAAARRRSSNGANLACAAAGRGRRSRAPGYSKYALGEKRFFL